MPGGAIGHLHARVEAVPAFSPGEEAYLCLWTAPNGAYRWPAQFSCVVPAVNTEFTARTRPGP